MNVRTCESERRREYQVKMEEEEERRERVALHLT